MNYQVKCSTIRDFLRAKNPDDVWKIHQENVKLLLPFWREAVNRITDLIEFDIIKRDKHLKAIDNAFTFMDDWRFERIKHIKARRNEIDSAISFIRNHALDRKVSMYLFAPICRNVASILRTNLYLSTHGYSDEQLPTVIAQDIFQMASIFTLLPFDTSNFVYYLPSNKSIHGRDSDNDFDNYHLMFENAGKKLNIAEDIQQINDVAFNIWKPYSDMLIDYKNEKTWNFPIEIWTLKSDELSKQLYYENMNKFYNR